MDRLTTKQYWEHAWGGLKLPAVARPSPDIQRLYDRHLPVGDDIRMMEVGCAPGQFMVYFHQRFKWQTDGVEYAEDAAVATRENLRLCQVPGTIWTEDFLKFQGPPEGFDVVFSAGFLEHFEDPQAIVSRFAAMANRLVITTVPNLCGLNGLISRLMRPAVYRMHKHLPPKRLKLLHEAAGLETVFCGWAGGIAMSAPADPRKTPFFATHPLLGRLLNLPASAVNRLFRWLNATAGIAPRSRLFSPTAIYIGAKRGV